MLNELVVNKIYKDCSFVHAVRSNTDSIEWRAQRKQERFKTIIKLIKLSGLITRIQLAKDLGISLPTFDKYIDQLVDSGQVVKTVDQGKGSGRGKKAIFTLPEVQS